MSNSFFTSPEVHVTEASFCEQFASEILNQALEKRGFICQRNKLLSAGGSKCSLPTASTTDMARNLQALGTNAHLLGKPNHILPSFFQPAQLLQCFLCRAQCSSNVGSETKVIHKSPPQFLLKVAWPRNLQITFLFSSNSALAPQIPSVTSAINLIYHSGEAFSFT